MDNDSGRKDDLGKVDHSLIVPRVLEEVVLVFMHGAKKYGRWNYTKGMEWSRVYSACLRHLNAFWSGKENDEESGLSHLAHAGAGIFMLLFYRIFNKGTDDRFKIE